MDIDLLSKMIKELILEHDRVALPGLGTFVAEMMPASFTDKGYTVTPPYRKLSFRPVQGDDGLLAALYASANGVGEDVAMAALSDFIAGMREILEKKKNVVFPGLGRLRATRENNFFFVADEDLDIYPEGFGLEPVSLKTHEETREELSSAIGSLRSIMDSPEETGGNAGASDPERKGQEQAPESNQANESGSLSEGIPDNDSGQDILPDASEKEDSDSTSGKNHVNVPEKEVPADISEKNSDDAVRQDVPADVSGSDAVSDTVGTGGKYRALYWILGTLGTIVLLLVLYMVIARIFPGVMDGILYNKEDYEILHNISQFKN